jgi:DUF4097 and DUF4098 domain-containing protein YvlB
MNKLIKYTTLATFVCFAIAVISIKSISTESFNKASLYFNKNFKNIDAGEMIDLVIDKDFDFTSEDKLKINMTFGHLNLIPTQSNRIKISLKSKIAKNRKISLDNLIFKKGNQLVVDLQKAFDDDDSLIHFLKIADDSISNSLTLEIEIPEKFNSLDINSVSADIQIRGIQPQNIKINTVSGDTIFENVKTPQLSLNSVSGDFKLLNSTSNDINISTVSGDLEFHSSLPEKYKISFRGVSGDLSGQKDFISDSGLDPAKKIKINTVSGNARFYAN